MPVTKPDADPRMPYQLPFPKDAQEEIVIPNAATEDDRLWVPQAENVWFRPLCLNRSQGYWMNLLRVRKAGVYRVSYTIYSEATSTTSASLETFVMKNGVGICRGSYASLYCRHTNRPDSHATATFIVELAADDYLDMRGKRAGTTAGTTSTVAV